MPLARISAITGASATARASAFAAHTRRAASRASGVATALIGMHHPDTIKLGAGGETPAERRGHGWGPGTGHIHRESVTEAPEITI
jgi:hypothetical protein